MINIRPIIELLYTGRCNIYQEVHEVNESGITRLKKNEPLYLDQPCRLSHESFPTSETSVFPHAEETIMLFISPELDIPLGSTIEVTQNGLTQTFYLSSQPAKFISHQEINLKLKNTHV